MPSNLPLELQLLIVELALPPLILSRLDERAELCQTFSLVHRSWTPVAQREIHEHVSCADEASILGLTAGVKGRWPIKRFRLEYLPACRSRFKRLMENALARGNIEQIWVSGRLSPSDHFIEGAHALNKLNLFNTTLWDAVSIIDEPTFRNLTYLYVRDTHLAPFPANLRLQTLLLCCVEVDFHDKTFFAGLSALRILGLIAAVPLPHVADNLPPLLRHLAYYDVDWESEDEEPDENDQARVTALSAMREKHRPAMAKLAQRLASCTTNTDAGERRPWSYVLEEEVERAGGKFTVIDADNFDLEEWVWSLGA